MKRPITATWRIECPYPPYRGSQRKPSLIERKAYRMALHAVDGDSDYRRGVAVLNIKVFPAARTAVAEAPKARRPARKMAGKVRGK